jgi:hypothetical protein
MPSPTGTSDMTRTAALFVAVTIASADLHAQGHKFQAFGVTSHDAAALKFRFSEADASSSSPVVISVTGRDLTSADRAQLTSLQQYWLSINVPKNLTFRSRASDACDFKRAGESTSCDHYIYRDSATGKDFHYYFYVGNWP